MFDYAAQSERLWLRALETEADVDEYLADFHKIATNEVATKYSSRVLPTTQEVTKEITMGRIPTPEFPWRRSYAVLLRPSSSNENEKIPVIGVIELPRETPGRGYDLSYALHPDYWGKGYAAEALKLFLDLYWSVRREKGEDVLFASIEPDNQASTKLVDKLGFKKGELKTAVFRRGRDKPEEELRDLQVWYLEQPPKTKKYNMLEDPDMIILEYKF